MSATFAVKRWHTRVLVFATRRLNCPCNWDSNKFRFVPDELISAVKSSWCLLNNLNFYHNWVISKDCWPKYLQMITSEQRMNNEA
jgi:hypothetical protein